MIPDTAASPAAPPAEPEQPATSGELVFLDPAQVRFSKEGDALFVSVSGGYRGRVEVLRSFPLSRPGEHLSLRDEKGEELGVLRDLAALTPQDRKLVEEELQRRYVLPVIQRVLSVKTRFGVVEWEVETDRGRRRFATSDLRERVVRPSPERVILMDTDENRYDVRDLNALDAHSRELVLRQL